MSSTRVNRHLANQEKLKIARELREELVPYRITIDLENESVNQEFESDALKQFFDKQKQEFDYFSSPITVTNEEVNSLISGIQTKWDDEQIKFLVGSSKKSILQSIVVPFGLGHIVAGYDKHGGNVTTVHNFENGVFATSEDECRYTEWDSSNKKGGFDRTPYDSDLKLDRKGNLVKNKDGNFQRTEKFNEVKKREIFSKMEEDQNITSGYTGKIIGVKRNNNIDKSESVISLEHITSTKEIETSSHNHLFAKGETKEDRQKYRVGLARSDENLTLIEGSMNNSKGAKDLKEWAMEKNKNDPSKTNMDYYDANPKLIDEEYKKSKSFLAKENFKAQVKKQAPELLITGASESMKMGLQQSIGLLLTEFFAATFDEISDAYKNGFKESLKNQNFFEALQVRLFRIAKRVAASWKNALSAFKEGAISAFLSNLVTMLINTLVTTGKRIVRVIREGFLSIMKALKMAMFPPEGMTRDEASDTALKLLATGVTVSLGILAEEVVEKTVLAFFTTHLPPLVPFAPMVSAIFVGSITGIASSILVYSLDQLDIFGVNNQRKHEFVLLELDNLIAESEFSPG